MGQRHQIFIKVPNPIKFNRYSKSWSDLSEAKKSLGNGKTTVIAIHHQWLYGRSAVVNLINIMDFTDDKIRANYNNPFFEDFMCNSYGEWKERMMMIIQVQSNKLHPRGLGIECMIYLNDDEPNMRLACDEGDNNDGITIVDAINRKYCFMNIFEQELNEEYESVYLLPSMVPVSASDYANAYYKKGGNIKFTKPLDKYEVLSLKELNKIFPKMLAFDIKQLV
jgi:hypothetical protein